MFIHSVTTPRRIEVSFNGGASTRGNRITLLTGPNGSGKTDVLATVADVFHGALQHPMGARVTWSREGTLHVAESLDPDRDMRRGRVRVIAQTFSPFSRFPGIERRNLARISPVYARGHSSDEEYVCIGFNKHSRVELNQLSLLIVENGVLRLSEQPKVARIAFDVLEELEFKNGIELTYLANERLSALMKVVDDREGIERILEQFSRTGHFIVDGEIVGKRQAAIFREELRRGDVGEISEFVRGSIHLIRGYADASFVGGRRELEKFTFRAFRGREGMSSDFPILQSFAFLRRLGLLELSRCLLTPYRGAPVDLTQTSSGQQQMLCSIFGLAAALEDEAIVLIDEPELSLHPRWQMNFFKHLETALEATVDCHIIVATHSPLIAQAAVAHGAEIIHMGDEAYGESARLNSKRNNSSIEGLLVDVFDTPIPNSLHISNEIFGLVTKAEAGDYWDKHAALKKLEEYLRLYRGHGEGSAETTALLMKAIRLLSGATPALG